MGTRLDSREAIAAFSAPAMKGFLRDVYARYDVVKWKIVVGQNTAVDAPA
ncbi:hypothetical protein ABZ769_10905 [Streptomyces olivoreticuli]